MARPRYSEILASRRRQLGLSIGQAAQVLRLRREVLEAFEEGDFERVPKGGYAQGMLSSYARYLDLDPQEMVDLFTEELEDYRRGGRGRAGRPQRGRADVGRQGQRARSSAGSATLPASGATTGPAGGFETTTVRRRDDARGFPQGRPYTGRAPIQGDLRADAGRARSRRRAEAPDDLRAARSGSYGRGAAADPYAGSARGRGDISTMPVREEDYQDDLRFGTDARSYRSASTQEGSRASRNIASKSRPNVRRRQQGGGSRRRGGPSKGFFSDPVRALVTIAIGVVLVLTIVIILSVSSCVSGKVGNDSSSKSVSVSTASTQSGSSGSGASSAKDAEEAAAEKQIQSQSSASSSTTTATETKVTISVADGQVTWLEVDNGGTSEVADTIDGPWEQTYTVTDTMTIRAGDTTAVTVTENGVQMPFESRVSGIGTITIQGTKAQDSTGTGTATGTDSTSSSASASTQGASGSSGGTSSTGSATGSAATGSSGTQAGSGQATSTGSSTNSAQGSTSSASGSTSAKMGGSGSTSSGSGQ
jgi:hypothetical protein